MYLKFSNKIKPEQLSNYYYYYSGCITVSEARKRQFYSKTSI